MNDVVLRNASIADGTGCSSFRGHLAIKDGRISEVSLDVGRVPSGTEVVDVDGLTVCPGFIDMHPHSDMAVVQPGDHSAKLAQGVTTELAGQDGLSLAPMRRTGRFRLPLMVESIYGPVDDTNSSWETVGEYLDVVDRGVQANQAYVVPLSNVRCHVMGYDQRPPTPDELQAMRDLVRTGMLEGAVGVSTGLTYPPGSFADKAELIEICTVVAELGGFHDTHQRSYGHRAYEAYEEVVEISEASGCALHLAHAEIDFPENFGRDRDLIRLIDDAGRRGVEISFDILPYDQANTMLAAMLPSWVHAGGPEETLRLLRDPDARRKIAHEMEVIGSDGAYGVPMGWNLFEISSSGSGEQWVGMRVDEAAAAAGRPTAEFYFDLLIADELDTMTLIHMGYEQHVANMMQHAAFTAGSDGNLRGQKPHPRGWGTFPRYLGRYVRESGHLRLEECIAHMTSVPARVLKLRDRGLVAEGYAADLVAFDADTVLDTATYDDPRTAPIGIPHVLVNGVFTVRDGVTSEVRAGHALRRGRDTYHRPA
ncbi:D-aminoacylase [Pseudonocardia ailaonensis]|uniref:D-aminoacylase n=1 Tax=Pseudonocardia ailaonensis TaxID=367279 RepID=A0ABN2MK11_9PSEU